MKFNFFDILNLPFRANLWAGEKRRICENIDSITRLCVHGQKSIEFERKNTYFNGSIK